MPSSQMLHPPRLAPIFATSPSAPGTPVHSIQTVRRKAAGHSGPLTKILVANRGVSPHSTPEMVQPNWIHPRKLRFEFFVRPMNWLCTPLLSILSKIAYLPIAKRSAYLLLFICKVHFNPRMKTFRRMRLIKWGRASLQLRHTSPRMT